MSLTWRIRIVGIYGVVVLLSFVVPQKADAICWERLIGGTCGTAESGPAAYQAAVQADLDQQYRANRSRIESECKSEAINGLTFVFQQNVYDACIKRRMPAPPPASSNVQQVMRINSGQQGTGATGDTAAGGTAGSRVEFVGDTGQPTETKEQRCARVAGDDAERFMICMSDRATNYYDVDPSGVFRTSGTVVERARPAQTQPRRVTNPSARVQNAGSPLPQTTARQRLGTTDEDSGTFGVDKSPTSPQPQKVTVPQNFVSPDDARAVMDKCNSDPQCVRTEMARLEGLAAQNYNIAETPEQTEARINALRSRAASLRSERPCDGPDGDGCIGGIENEMPARAQLVAGCKEEHTRLWFFTNDEAVDNCVRAGEARIGLTPLAQNYPSEAGTRAADEVIDGVYGSGNARAASVPPGYWDPNGPYPRGADDKILGAKEQDVPEGWSYYSNAFRNFFGGGSSARPSGSRPSNERAVTPSARTRAGVSQGAPRPGTAAYQQLMRTRAGDVDDFKPPTNLSEYASQRNLGAPPAEGEYSWQDDFDQASHSSNAVVEEPCDSFWGCIRERVEDIVTPDLPENPTFVEYNSDVDYIYGPENPTSVDYDPNVNYMRPEIEQLPILYPDGEGGGGGYTITPYDQRIEVFELGSDESQTVFDINQGGLLDDGGGSWIDNIGDFLNYNGPERSFARERVQNYVAGAFGAFPLKK